MIILKRICVMATLLFSVNALGAGFSGTLSISPTVPASLAVAGQIDTANATISMDTTQYQGTPLTMLSGELLQPGTYNRTHQSNNVTFSRFQRIAEGHLGAYIVFGWNGDSFAVFMQWAVTNLGVTHTNIEIAGNTIRASSLKGEKITLDFVVDGPDPFINVAAVLQGDIDRECTGYSGATVVANLTSVFNSQATIASIDWTYNGSTIGNSEVLTHDFLVGNHTVDVVAVTDQGATASDTISFSVSDTQAPNLIVQFLDLNGVPVTSAANGNFEVSLQSTDVCDSAPVIQATAKPVMNVINGDLIQVIQTDGSVSLPTSGVDITAYATDVNGNGVTVMESLTIE